jgi:alkylated DNA repair protein alkB family protein 8
MQIIPSQVSVYNNDKNSENREKCILNEMIINNPIEFERKYVENVYDKIASDFDKTRAYLWLEVKKFLILGNPEDSILEIGCGNGKNLEKCIELNYNLVIGCDISSEMIKICKNKNLTVFKACATELPIEDNTFSRLISVAMLHHLSTHDRRKMAIKEIFRILQIDGCALIQVWALEQPVDAKRQFNKQDNIVTWKNSKNNKNNKIIKIKKNKIVPLNLLPDSTDMQLFQNQQKNSSERYYHVFKQGELESLIKEVLNENTHSAYTIHIEKSFYEVGNWGVIIKKTNL